MNEMIERVAEAIQSELDKLTTVENYGGFMNECAMAAIKAMREPTEEMINEVTFNAPAGEIIGYSQAANAWREMIDVALKDD